MRPETMLAWLLRGTAVVMGSAIVPAVMPMAWMDAVHRALGMGPLPQGPVVEYMARTLSAFYAFHGGLLWIFAGDIRRYAPAIRFCFATGLLFGAALLIVDTQAGLPARWALAEGPFVAALSATALVLLARVRREAAAGEADAAAPGSGAKSS